MTGMVTPEEYLGIVDLLARYAHAIDSNQLESWVECFTPTCHYKIITMENVAAGLPAGVLTCDGQAMLKDRVAYLRKAAIYNVHTDRHILGQPLIRRDADGKYAVTTGFAVYQSEPDRESRLFAVGHYEDVIARWESKLCFESKLVVLENNSVTPLLSSPI